MSIVKHNLIGASGQGGYFIDRSVRIRGSAGAYMYRTPASAGNRQTWTFSVWVKGGPWSSAAFQSLLSTPTYSDKISFYSNYIRWYLGNGAPYLVVTYDQYFRDPSAWYHFVFTLDTTNATAADRMRIYQNGVRQSGSGWSSTLPPQNYSSGNINNATEHRLGQSAQFDGYMTEINFIDGQALEPTDFGEFDDITGVWKPKKYVGSYGTNGFYLDFGDPTSTVTLCADQSGTGNNWTAANISLSSGSTYDSMEDVPTLTGNTAANYATLNTLIPNDIENPFDSTNSLTISEAALKVATTSVAHAFGTIPLTSGKWYWEGSITAKSASSDNYTIGIYDVSRWGLGWNSAATRNSGYVWYQSGNVWDNGTAVLTGNTYTTNDILGIALDLDNGKIYFSKNNTWINSGDPVAGTGASASGIDTTKQWLPVLGSDNNSMTSTWVINFGQRPFAYTPPTGFNRLNTYNLPDSTIEDGSKQFNTVLYSGNSSTQSITGVGFQPDLVWGKSRNIAENNAVYDVVRGTTKALYTNLTNVEGTDPGVSSFDSDGFSLGGSTINASGYTYAAWNWKANGSGVSNTVGDTNATVSANTTSGFSIVSFNAGAAGNHTVGHGLGVTPEMIIMKDRDTAGYGNWTVFHSAVCTSTSNYLLLNGTGGLGSVANSWGSALPTSTVFGFGSNVNIAANDDIISYCFADIEGFSAFGKYIGNGSTDGPFIYTGFRPAWVMVKRTSSSGTEWVLFDDKRDTYNEVIRYLFPSSSVAESTATAYYGLDFVSNGFKWRKVHTPTNSSGATYIYAAFAENPFKNALAR